MSCQLPVLIISLNDVGGLSSKQDVSTKERYRIMMFEKKVGL